MRRLVISGLGVLAVWLAAGGDPASGQTFNSGSTGSDLAFSPTSSVTVTVPASGVFNYTTVNIPAGVTVTYARNTANTPLTILASGNVTIAGTIDVSAANGGGGAITGTILAPNAGRGGPGGFDGGNGANGVISNNGGSGLGPGGGGGGVGPQNGAGGGFATPGTSSGTSVGGVAYGNANLLPTIGGSGGGGGGIASFGSSAPGGGGGGGAVTIASSGTITLTGAIRAHGGSGASGTSSIGASGGGSGGAIRLMATTIAGSGGTVDAAAGLGANGNGPSGAGSVGRIRIESFTNGLTANFGGVAPSVATPGVVFLANTPSLQIVSVAGVAAPATPGALFSSPDITLPATTTNPVNVALSAANIPPGTVVSVRAQGQVDAVTSTSATLAGTLGASTATASLAIPTNQPAVLTATASFTILASAGTGPVFVQGEEVERVRVSATLGGVSRVTYVTKSGREIVLTGR